MPTSKSLWTVLTILVVLATAGTVRSFAFERSIPRSAKQQQLYLSESKVEIAEHDNDVITSQLSRRTVMGGALSFAATTLLGARALAAPVAVLNKPDQKAIKNIGDGKPFALNSKLTIRPDKREAWIKEIKAFQKSTRQDEENSLQFSISEDVKTPNAFYLHQQYKDTAAFRAHLESPHTKRYEGFLVSEMPFAKGGKPTTYFFSPQEEGADWAVKNKRSDPPKTAYCVTVNLYPKKSKRAEFLEVIKANKQGTDTTEKLALQYTFGESPLRPGVFHFHEEYKGKEEGEQGFEAHANSPHFAGWVKFTETDPFHKPPEVYFSKILEG